MRIGLTLKRGTKPTLFPALFLVLIKIVEDIIMKEGVLLVNLGNPDKPEVKEIRHFLKHFLADQRVVAMPKAVWLPVKSVHATASCSITS